MPGEPLRPIEPSPAFSPPPKTASEIVVAAIDLVGEYLPSDSGTSAEDIISRLLALFDTPKAVEIYEEEMAHRRSGTDS